MAEKTGISWAESTWNFLVGCTKVSPGCERCYAETLVNRFAGTSSAFPNRFDVVTIRSDKFLYLPFKWREPRRIFVNSLSDVFHEDVPDRLIAKAFAVMALTPRHTYELLTKRHARMRSLLNSAMFQAMVAYEAGHITIERGLAHEPSFEFDATRWPLPNLWLGVSVEDQQWANIRIPALTATPAAVRWLSMEPLLGPVDLFGDEETPGPAITRTGYQTRTDYGTGTEYDTEDQVDIDWVVVGGESGRGARRMAPEWIFDLWRQCENYLVPFHFKQAGAVLAAEWGVKAPGSTPADWPTAFPREYPETATV